MRITFVCNEYPPASHGGIGTAVQMLAQQLSVWGHEVSVVGVYSETGEEVDRQGVRVVRLQGYRIPKVSWYLNRRTLALWLAKEVKRRRIDVIEAPDFSGFLIWPPSGSITVLRLHGSTFYFPILLPWPRKMIVGWAERTALRTIPYWIAPSKFALETIQRMTGLQPKSSAIVGNPVDTTVFKPAPKDSATEIILFVGTLVERKGVLSLATAANMFLRSFPKVRLVFIGRETVYKGRPISEEIRNRAGQDLSDRLVFLGALPHNEIARWMQRATLCVMPSFAETFGLVWAEAMACGCPLVASTLTSGPEIVEDGVSGLLADPRYPEDIAAKVSLLLSDREFARSLGENARRRVIERFSAERVAEQTLSFYKAVLRGR